jgi:hypothetical protein
MLAWSLEAFVVVTIRAAVGDHGLAGCLEAFAAVASIRTAGAFDARREAARRSVSVVRRRRVACRTRFGRRFRPSTIDFR